MKEVTEMNILTRMEPVYYNILAILQYNKDIYLPLDELVAQITMGYTHTIRDFYSHMHNRTKIQHCLDQLHNWRLISRIHAGDAPMYKIEMSGLDLMRTHIL